MQKDFIFLDVGDMQGYGIRLTLRETRQADENGERVPTYVFDIRRDHDGEIVGDIELRIGNNEGTFYGGHVRYHVLEEHRGNGYANKACLLLPRLAKRHGMHELRMTCDPENYASCRTCEIAGAVGMGTLDIPEGHEMYGRGMRKAALYIMEI